jgi:adenylate kinase family enzyme
MSTISVKVAYDDSIIMLRVPRTINLTDMRHRLHDKLVRQEKVPLGKSFAIARVIQTSPLKSAFAQTLPGRASSIPRMRIIESQEEWDQVVDSISSTEKLNIRVLD